MWGHEFQRFAILINNLTIVVQDDVKQRPGQTRLAPRGDKVCIAVYGKFLKRLKCLRFILFSWNIIHWCFLDDKTGNHRNADSPVFSHFFLFIVGVTNIDLNVCNWILKKILAHSFIWNPFQFERLIKTIRLLIHI